MAKFVHKLTKSNRHNYSLIIPAAIIKKFGWKERQKITIIEKLRKCLELKDWRRK